MSLKRFAIKLGILAPQDVTLGDFGETQMRERMQLQRGKRPFIKTVVIEAKTKMEAEALKRGIDLMPGAYSYGQEIIITKSGENNG